MQKASLAHLLTMRSSLLLLAYGLLGNLPAQAQTSSMPVIAGNTVWLDSVQHLPLAQQVAAVQQRAWRDTLLAPYQIMACRMGFSAATSYAAVAADTPPGKPTGFPLVYVVDGHTFYNHDAATIRQFQHLVRRQPIQQVTVLRQASAAAIYGSRAANGGVVLSSVKCKQRH
jgi:TonB-dependent SusC/RagA subfamily outer membrane receptor